MVDNALTVSSQLLYLILRLECAQTVQQTINILRHKIHVNKYII